jgi:PAS domain S-box-containing protein
LILLTDIPDNYVSISSGLGQAKPNALLIVPIKSEEEVEGVIELVSFKEFTDYEVKFVEEICQKIGSVILTVKANQRTQLLLKSSEEASRQAQLREEELLKQVQNYEHWISEFEKKLNRVSDDAFMYQSIINKLFAGFIITDEKFTITKVNNYITKSFNYQKNDLIGQALDILIEADYENIIDLRNKRFNLSYGSFRESVVGRVVDSLGRVIVVEMISGKIEINNQVMYVFLFNELESEEKLGKPSSSVFGQNYRSAS